MNCPQHLGGHNNKTHTDEGVLKFLRNEFPHLIKLVDVGSGPGGQVAIARAWGFDAVGIDGDPTLNYEGLIRHDYTKGSVDLPFKPDIIWSVEFLEHVEEQYLPNVFDTFKQAKYVICTHALPGETGGHHHVNLQSEDWWIYKFAEHGLTYNQELTDKVREASNMKKGFIKKTGKVFVNR